MGAGAVTASRIRCNMPSRSNTKPDNALTGIAGGITQSSATGLVGRLGFLGFFVGIRLSPVRFRAAFDMAARILLLRTSCPAELRILRGHFRGYSKTKLMRMLTATALDVR